MLALLLVGPIVLLVFWKKFLADALFAFVHTMKDKKVLHEIVDGIRRVVKRVAGGCGRKNECPKRIHYGLLRKNRGLSPIVCAKLLRYYLFSILKILLSFFLFCNLSNASNFTSPTSGTRLTNCEYGDTTCASSSYHTGQDYDDNSSLDIKASNAGKVVRNEIMWYSGPGVSDHGMGTNLIIEHVLDDNSKIYTTYSHLASVKAGTDVGVCVDNGQVIATMGGSGYGNPNYWSRHLHFEIKEAAVTGAPWGGSYWGYTPNYPDNYGYVNPLSYIGSKNAKPHPECQQDTLPDLTASAIVGSNFTAGQKSAQAQVTVSRSGGPLNTPGSSYVYARLYWTSSSTDSTSSTILWSSNGSTPDFPYSTLNNIGSNTVTATFDIPNVSPGTYYIIAYADANYWDTESNENNNYTRYQVTVTSASALPDLTAAATVASSYQSGQSGVQIPVTVMRTGGNLGDQGGTYVYARLYWSTNSTWDASDTVLWSSNGSTPDFPYSTLNSVGSKTVNATINIPSVSAGTYYLIAYADANYWDVESNESNNWTAYGVNIVGPGLLPAPVLSTPSNGATGVLATPTFSWSSVSGASRYWLMVATSSSAFPTDPNATTCPSCVISGNTSTTSHTLPTSFPNGGTTGTLNPGTNYYWKVQGYSLSPTVQGQYSATGTFTTAATPTYAVALSASPTAGGTVSGAGSYAAGTSRTVTATANSGYTFSGWTGNSVCTSQNPCNFTMPLAEVTLTATFNAIPTTYAVTLSASPSAGGTVSGAGSYTAGTSRTVTATANSGYTFAGWSGYAGCSSQNPCTFTMPSQAVNLTATFSATVNGVCSAASNGVYFDSATRPTNLCSSGTANTPSWMGYSWAWTCSGTSGTYVSCATSATAPTYTLALSASPNAGGSVNGAGSYAVGTSRTVTATAYSGYTFAGWRGYAGCSNQNPCTFTMPSQAVNLTATFTPTNTNLDVFPANCQIPTGWSVPNGSNAGWSVVTNDASEGTCSLKSDPILEGQMAQIQFNGLLGSGNITFSRKVSSETGWDCLHFYVDGQQQDVGGTCVYSGGPGASSEVPWGTVSVPVSAGVHTLVWSYEKYFSGWLGQDAAWIDAVVLPMGNGGYLPVITQDPADQSVTAGQVATFTAAASSLTQPITVQWRRTPYFFGVFTDIPGATSPTYSFTANTSDTGSWYYAVFTNSAGSTSTVAGGLTVTAGGNILTITKSGAGTGTVTSLNIYCGSVCSVMYVSGTSVTLYAAAAAGSTFTGWSGGGCSGTGNCTVNMNQAQSVTATFVNVTTPPICTLTATPVVISAGGSSTLTASCTPAATSYTWTNSGFGSTVSNGTVSPITPTVYTVVASNAAGSNTASTAVYVCNTRPWQFYAGQTLVGTGTSESFHSGIGNDTIDGGAGIDTVIYNCNRSSFTLTKTASGWVVSSGAEGIDTLTNIDRIQFPNETLALDISGNAGQAYRLYQAAFNRNPDNGGLKFWIGALDNGASLNDVATGFINSTEFQSLYGTNPTNQELVTKLYSNVLHRTPDQGGFDFWTGLLNNNQISRVQTLVSFSESPENQAGVIGSILNGIDLLN